VVEYDTELQARIVVGEYIKRLAELRESHGSPSFDRMQRAARRAGSKAGSKTTFHRILNSAESMPDAEIVRGFVLGLGLPEESVEEWESLRRSYLSRIRNSSLAEARQESGASETSILPADTVEVKSSARPLPVEVPTQRSRLLVGSAVIAVSFFASGYAVARWAIPPAHSAVHYAPGAIRGKPDFQAACNAQLGPGRTAKITNPNSSSGWECLKVGMVVRTGRNGVDVTTQCAMQFPGSEAKALRPEDPASWVCVQKA
jgi:hypothetical protein